MVLFLAPPGRGVVAAARPRASGARRLTGALAVLFPLLHLASDVLAVVQGDFSLTRLGLTYAGEAGIALLVVGLVVLVHDWIPVWAVVGGLAYAYAFVFFTGTVLWVIVARTPRWEDVQADFGWWLTVHGAVMVVGGVAFGAGIVRSGALPPWTGWALVVGVLLVAATAGLGNLERAAASAVPDVALVGMGVACLRRSGPASRQPVPFHVAPRTHGPTESESCA